MIVLLNGTYCFVTIFNVACAARAPIAAQIVPTSLAPNLVLRHNTFSKYRYIDDAIPTFLLKFRKSRWKVPNSSSQSDLLHTSANLRNLPSMIRENVG